MTTAPRTVRFTTGPLGLVENEDQIGFVDETVKAGDVGEVIGPHPRIDGWLLVRVDVAGRSLLCPVPAAWIEDVS